ncbi:MAG: hypothetical protein JSR76_00250 [Verrucomicrobia bacterium]|nr:hypothetical protein [Verrucomicrobiota bacterium]
MVHRRNSRRNLGIVLAIIGLVLILFSYYINHRVDEGRVKIHSAQEKVDTVDKLAARNSTTKQVGEVATAPVKSKIEAGKMDVARYHKIAKTLQIAGVICVVLGAGFVFLAYRRP